MTEPGIPADRVETADSRLRMGQLLIAVIVGAGIWNLIVSLFNCVIVPWIGGVMGPNSSLPASFTERPYDYPDLFVAVLEFAVAGLVAVGVNAMLVPRKKVVRVKVIKKPVPEVARIIPEAAPLPPAPPQPVPTEAKPVSHMAASVPAREFEIAPPSPPPVRPTPPPPSVRPAPPPPVPVVAPVQAAAAPPPASPPKAKPEPAKPKKPKQVYYNLVGEPVESDDD